MTNHEANILMTDLSCNLNPGAPLPTRSLQDQASRSCFCSMSGGCKICLLYRFYFNSNRHMTSAAATHGNTKHILRSVDCCAGGYSGFSKLGIMSPRLTDKIVNII